ncbi:inhibitor of vertebrate lysozyme family protein [Sphingobium sufflavum]|uniref:inhibitor of vertebrate lysozyme family protein n=1 Tax=Sphingobium sufflavum TaxID=1129547 RepID=UPI001F2F4207|nr:inhibitor of vertebrate lysozyme family protein [Sphingobium sufflavum]MCE7796357.1 inhibitor of vertebrate lysozyme family protein [Sphingobium sufflavum]
MEFARMIAIATCLSVTGAAQATGPATPFPPGYEKAYAAYIASLPTEARKLVWLVKLNQVSSQPRSLKLGATTVVYLFGCKSHYCDTDQANVFLLPDRKSALAVIKVNGVQRLVGGAGSREAACVVKLDASDGVASAC